MRFTVNDFLSLSSIEIMIRVILKTQLELMQSALMFNSYEDIGVIPVIQEEAVSLGSSAVLTND